MPSMFVRNLGEVEATEYFVEWGNGTSHRLITKSDGMGFTVCYTTVRAGTQSLLEYRNHLEACFCISGKGEIEDMNGKIYPIKPGVLYGLDEHDRHFVRADRTEHLILLSVFVPPLAGSEVHNLDPNRSSSY
jgi:L-ectoine synthase